MRRRQGDLSLGVYWVAIDCWPAASAASKARGKKLGGCRFGTAADTARARVPPGR